MKHNIFSYILLGASLFAAAGCEKENSYLLDGKHGQINCDALTVDYVNRGTRAGDINLGDFTVNFIDRASKEVVRSFSYSEMPEIVALPVGSYSAQAVYGDGTAVAEWDNPFYQGSSPFTIEAGKITQDIDPITCTLNNIKVDVEVIDNSGREILGEDIEVKVSAGEGGELIYDAEHFDNSGHFDKTGYFKADEGSNTLVAELSGTIDGAYFENVFQAFGDAQAGHAYTIRFTINRPENVGEGNVTTDSGISVDATIEIRDETKEFDPNDPDDKIIVDDMRPVDGSGSTTPDDPGTDPEPANGPQVTSDCLNLDDWNILTAESEVRFTVTSSTETGITGFLVDIDSDKLTPDELSQVGLSDHLDLINPGELEESLNGLGFKTGDQVKGQSSVEIDITQFVPMLQMLQTGNHEFILTVTDSSGTTEQSIKLKVE